MSTARPDPFPITAAQLSGNFCQTLFYGMYLVTCTFCVRTLFMTGSGRDERWLRLHEIRWMMVVVAFILFALSTFDVSIGLLHNFHAFVESKDPVTELQNIADWINIARSIDQAIVMILGDFILIYRCWIVHARRWLVIAPSLLLYFGGIAMAIKLIEVEANPSTQRDITLNSRQIRPWWIAFFAITAAQNILTTSILIWRIWRVERQSERYMDRGLGPASNRPRHLRKVIRVIAESGAAYTLCVFITAIVSATESNALYPMSDMTLQATGIAFNAILVRSSARRDQQFTVFDQNERATVLDTIFSSRTTASSTMKGSVNLNPRDSRSHDIELAIVSDHDNATDMTSSSQTDIYPGGIKVTRTIVKS